MVFARVRRVFRNTPTSKFSPASVADAAPSAKHKKGRKDDQALVKNMMVPCDLPGAVPQEDGDRCRTAETKDDNHAIFKTSRKKDDACQESRTAEPKDDDQNDGQDDDILKMPRRGGVPASVQGSVDEGIPKDDSKKTHAGSEALSRESTLPSDHLLMCKLRAVLDEQPLAEFNPLRPSQMHLKLSAESDRRRWGAFDGRWKLDDDSIRLPKRFHELMILQGYVADAKGRVQTLKMMKRQRILWDGRPVMLSEDKDELIIIDTHGWPVKYARAHSSRNPIADSADSTLAWE